MKNTVEPMSEGIRRQRRSLIITSLILSFMKYGGITIKKISVLGVEILLSNISALYVFIWLIWFYFLIRYYQYFMQEGVPKMTISFQTMLTEICRAKIKALVKAEHPRVQGSSQQFDYNILKKSNWYTINYVGQELKEADVYNASNPFEMDIKLWSLWKEILISYYQVFVNKSVMTDYILPLLIAAFAFIYSNLGNWPGNIFNIFFTK